MSFEVTGLLLSWAAIALLGLALSGILRQIHLLRSAITMPDSATLPAAFAEVVERPPAPELAPTHSTLTVALFSNPDCSSCSHLLPVFEELAEQSDVVEFAVVFPGEGNGLRSRRVRMLQNQRHLFEALRIPVTPFALVVDANGSSLESSPVGSPSMLEAFVRNASNGG